MGKIAAICSVMSGLLLGCQESQREAAPQAELVPVTELDFDDVVLENDRPVLVDFYADWCGPCQVLEPTLQEIAADYKDRVTVAQVDIDDEGALADRYRISAIPRLILFVDGEPVENFTGVVPKEAITASLDKYVSQSNPPTPESDEGRPEPAVPQS